MSSSELRSKLHFPSIIGKSKKELDEFVKNIDSHYREWYEVKVDKKTNQPKTYKDGTIKQRAIRPSKAPLKAIQKQIKDRVLVVIELPENVHGGVKKRSNITNAKPHQGKKYILTTDLQDFYPSITAKKVYETFLELGFNAQCAFYITRLTTWKGELPQGTPTSTHISNIVFLRTDYKLIELCNAHNITYTRYIDDLTFSSQSDFQNIIEEILGIVLESGLKISRRKTFYNGAQTVTGIKIFLNKIDAPEKIIAKVKAEEILPDGTMKPYTSYRNNILKTNNRKK
ncbi:reverse transcriptase family protein [Sphingobacterium thalpophilum]|uniref:Reverse transcriptase family protein n=1 Tax=Sphingobacterium thalpophilum TaxID=259 RepID=A0ACD5C824_9SPHI